MESKNILSDQEVIEYEKNLKGKLDKGQKELEKIFIRYKKYIEKRGIKFESSDIQILIPLTKDVKFEDLIKIKKRIPQIIPEDLCYSEFKELLDLIKRADLYDETNVKALEEYKEKHTNKRGKAWRADLYEFAKLEYQQNQILDKTKALKTAFEKLSDKELYKEEFEKYFKSIYEKFIKMV